MKMLPLTGRQRELVGFLSEYTRKFGYSPTYAVIQRRLKLRSISTVHKHLVAIRSKGWVTWEPHDRHGLRLLREPLALEVSINGGEFTKVTIEYMKPQEVFPGVLLRIANEK